MRYTTQVLSEEAPAQTSGACHLPPDRLGQQTGAFGPLAPASLPGQNTPQHAVQHGPHERLLLTGKHLQRPPYGFFRLCHKASPFCTTTLASLRKQYPASPTSPPTCVGWW